MEINIPLLICSDSSACIRKSITSSQTPALYDSLASSCPSCEARWEAGLHHFTAQRKTKGYEKRKAPGPPANQRSAPSQPWHVGQRVSHREGSSSFGGP